MKLVGENKGTIDGLRLHKPRLLRHYACFYLPISDSLVGIQAYPMRLPDRRSHSNMSHMVIPYRSEFWSFLAEVNIKERGK